jgi:DNA-binding NarL/FixJ family response regulator
MSNNGDPIRVMAVDDHPIVRDGIAALIASESDMRLVAEASTGREAIEQFRLQLPDITLMDLQMPELSGIDALIAIRGECPSARVIVLTTYAGDALAARALKAGAMAYVLKGLVRKDLLETIRAVHRGLKRIHPDVAAQLVSHLGEDALSTRELEVLALVAAGNSNKLIGVRLSISEDTVKAHLKSVLAKLGANDRTHAVMLALERGILSL